MMPRHARHALGQFLGGGDGQGGLLEEEASEQLREFLFAVGQRLDLPLASRLGDAHGQPFLAADEPAEFQIVGQKPVGQAVAVTGELLAVRAFAALHLVEIRADVLGLDVAEGHALAGDLKSGLPQRIRFGSFVAVMPLPTISSSLRAPDDGYARWRHPGQVSCGLQREILRMGSTSPKYIADGRQRAEL